MTVGHNDPRFQRALNHVLHYEGGYVDHPKDPGGATKFGITRRTLAKWRTIRPWWQLPKTAVKKMGRVEAAQIYYKHYWLRSGIDTMPEALGFVVFDFAVNSGPSRAVKHLQWLLSVGVDGGVGLVTQAALKQYCQTHTEQELIKVYVARRHRFLRRLRTYSVFGRGWSNRLSNVVAVSQKILQTSKSIKEEKTMEFLTGYKTYLIALFMLFSGVLELMGVNVPAVEANNAMQLVMEALAVLFLRKGLKTEIANA